MYSVYIGKKQLASPETSAYHDNFYKALIFFTFFIDSLLRFVVFAELHHSHPFLPCFIANNESNALWTLERFVACAAAGLFVSNSGFNRLRISARYLVSNSTESHGYILSLLICFCLVFSQTKVLTNQKRLYISLRLNRI